MRILAIGTMFLSQHNYYFLILILILFHNTIAQHSAEPLVAFTFLLLAKVIPFKISIMICKITTASFHCVRPESQNRYAIIVHNGKKGDLLTIKVDLLTDLIYSYQTTK